MSAQDELGELVERLRAGIPYEYDASENRLVSDISGMDDLMSEAAAAITSLIAERDGLREALAPFADFGEYLEVETEGFSDADELDLVVEDTGFRLEKFYVGAFRRARTALSLDTNKGDGV